MTPNNPSDRPDPVRAGSSADLARELRLLKMWAGDPSLRTLAKRTGIPASTLSDALNGSRPLPRLPVLRGLVDDLDPASRMAWEAAWRRARAADLGARERQAAEPGVPAPRQLPFDVRGFVGRESLLRELDDLLDPAGRPPAAVLSALTGSGGVGKTALAVHWGHRVAGRFTDGQLYVDLAGFGPGRPRTATEVHGLFLRGLGVAAASVPVNPDERLALYRSLTADRSLLVVLDNAATPEQVRPLLPSSPDSFTVVTTRHAFTGLRARDGAVRLYVDRLTPPEALELLASLIGERVAAEPEAALSFVERCSRLPLTLRVAARHAADRPEASLAQLVADLSSRELDFFADPGDPYSDARAVFSWSLDELDADAARLFRLLGLHPGRHVDAHSAAALADIPYEDAEQQLGTLLHAHLIDEMDAPESYGTHDLLRAYAVELSSTLDSATVEAARERLADYYVHTVAGARDAEHPWDPCDHSVLPGSDRHARRFDDSVDGAAWLDSELEDIVAVAAQTAAHRRPEHTRQLSALLWRRLHLRSLHDQGMALHRHAFDVAETYGDDVHAGAAAFRIGDVWWRIGGYTEALAWFERAREHKRRADDKRGLGHVLSGLGTVHLLTGDLDAALECYRECRELAAAVGAPDSECVAMHNLAEVHARRGEHRLARDLFAEVVELAERHNLRDCLTTGLIGRATEHVRLDEPEAADADLRRAADLARELDSADLHAQILLVTGIALAARGRRPEAEGHLRRSLRMFTELGNAAGKSEAAAELAKVE
ncbi:tetratricopeptide repeat protein [Phytomonospora sp. NPDC050363]|uniref:ATP-binding protein n=1 Tax=Phytomonospora sp. NPDC050363 TaxID=3155642 RepID=UPI0033EDD73E